MLTVFCLYTEQQTWTASSSKPQFSILIHWYVSRVTANCPYMLLNTTTPCSNADKIPKTHHLRAPMNNSKQLNNTRITNLQVCSRANNFKNSNVKIPKHTCNVALKAIQNTWCSSPEKNTILLYALWCISKHPEPFCMH